MTCPWHIPAVLVMLLLAGCAGYQVGPTNRMAAGEKSVRINPFVNQTQEPRLTDAVSTQLRAQLQADATYRLGTREESDIILSGALTKYDRTAITFQPNDIVTVANYRLSLTARVSARERATGKVLLDQPVSGFTLIQVGNDLTSAEREAMPLLAGDLARNITALLADGEW